MSRKPRAAAVQGSLIERVLSIILLARQPTLRRLIRGRARKHAGALTSRHGIACVIKCCRDGAGHRYFVVICRCQACPQAFSGAVDRAVCVEDELKAAVLMARLELQASLFVSTGS